MRWRIITSLCVAIAGCSIAGCNEKSAKEQRTGAADRPVAPAAAGDSGVAAKAAAAEATAEPIADSEAAALIDAWLGAQNQGDLAAYEALYARRFTGIKRAGARTRQYDRDGWVKDRGRMFRRKMTVTADDRKITAGARTAVVTFTQTWASGSFQDAGPKQLVLVREDGALRIAREEMLRSTVLAPGAEAAALAGEDFVFAIEESGAAYVVIDTEAQDAWASSDTILVSPAAMALRAVNRAALPAELAAWQGKQVTIFSADEPACTGPIESLAVMTGFEPHFGTMHEWRDSNASDERLAREVWEMGSATRFLVGRVAAECKGMLQWARANKRPAPGQYARAPAGDPLEAAVIERFRALAGYRAIQKAYTEETGETARWDQDEGSAPSVVVFRDLASGRGIAAVSVRAGAGCGAFYGEFWALFETMQQDGKPALVLLTDDTEPGELFIPETVIDADGDGNVELVGTGALVRKVGAVYRQTASVRFPSYDCPC